MLQHFTRSRLFAQHNVRIRRYAKRYKQMKTRSFTDLQTNKKPFVDEMNEKIYFQTDNDVEIMLVRSLCRLMVEYNGYDIMKFMDLFFVIF